MSQALTIFPITAAVTVLLMLTVWGVSIVKRDVSIVDICWGLGFALIAVTTRATANGYAPRMHLITALTVVWGLRLSLYLLWRNWGQGEDFRYQAFRKRYGERFWLVSLYLVFGLQGLLMWVVSLPVQIAQIASVSARLTGLDAMGTLLWAIGLGFEAVGDWQLARFKSDPANRGKVMDRGLWRYTRHPNYFGDALVWWGLFVIASATPAGVWTVIGPVVMTVFLMRVSGVPLLERKLVRTRPEYRDYMQRTSAFVPWFPKA
jgi:steroid 5-alpha reductase family enzyme